MVIYPENTPPECLDKLMELIRLQRLFNLLPLLLRRYGNAHHMLARTVLTVHVQKCGSGVFPRPFDITQDRPSGRPSGRVNAGLGSGLLDGLLAGGVPRFTLPPNLVLCYTAVNNPSHRVRSQKALSWENCMRLAAEFIQTA